MPPLSAISPASLSPVTEPLAYIVRPDAEDVAAFGLGFLRVLQFRSADRAIAAMQDRTPDLVVLNVTDAHDDALRLCFTARRMVPPPALLALCNDVRVAPAALRAGCKAVLIRPVTRNLVAARVGRLLKCKWRDRGAFAPPPEVAYSPDACPLCRAPRPIGFDAVGLRRWWFACLACDHTWIDRVSDKSCRRARARPVPSAYTA